MGKNKPLLWTAILTAAGTGSAAAQITGTPTAGDFYFKNVESGKFLGGANDWGTQASLIDHGIVFKVALNNGKYTLDSNFTGYFTGTYMDGAAADVEITETATPGQYIMKVGDKYLAAAGSIIANSEADATKAAKWQIIPVADLKKAFETATFDAPADATFLIKGANVSRNFEENSAWQGSPAFEARPNVKLEDPAYNPNVVAEKWNTNFDVYQEIADVPNGLYKLTCQALYRAGGNASTSKVVNAKLYANENSVDVPSFTSYPLTDESMIGASKAFLAGAYKSEPVYVYVSDGKLKIGIKKETLINGDWTVFDNFELAYVGDIDMESIREELTQKLAIQINKANKYTDDEALRGLAVEAAKLQTTINEIVASNPEAYVMVANYQSGVKGNIGEQIEEIGKDIAAATANYEGYVAATEGHADLVAYLQKLTDTYNAAGDETKAAAKGLYDENVKLVSDFKAAAEEAYKNNAAAAFAENIKKNSDAIKASIDDAIKAITTGNTNAISYANVVTEITAAKNAYNNEAAKLYALLAGAKDGSTYNDTYVEALSKLNAYSRDIKAVEDANKANYDAGTANDETQAKYEGQLDEIVAGLPSVLAEYEELVGKEDAPAAGTLRGNYKAATAEVDGLSDDLQADVEDVIGGRGEVKAHYSKDVEAIKAAIKALQANVDKANAAHTIKSASPYCENFDKDKEAIEKSISDLNAKAVKSAAEYDANAATLTTIKDVQTVFDNAKAAVGKLASADKSYVSTGRFATSETAIQDAINALSKGAFDAYKVDGTGDAAGYNSKLSTDAIKASVADYQAKAEASLAAYEKIVAAIANYKALLNGTPAVGEEGKEGYVPATPGLVGTATNTEVTVDGKMGGTTYAAAIEGVNEDIVAVQTALDKALAEVDVKHYEAITKVDVKSAIETTIKDLTDSYSSNETAWNAAQLEAAKTSLLEEATRRADVIKPADGYDAKTYGKAAAELNTKNGAIKAKIAEIQESIETAKTSDKDADAIALLATVVKDLETVEADYNALNVAAKKAAEEYAADQKALAELQGEVARLGALLNGGEYNKVTYNGVAKIDGDGKNRFTTEISNVNALITAITGDINTSNTNETVRKDRDAEKGYASRLKTIEGQINNLLGLAANEAANDKADGDFDKAYADAKVDADIAAADAALVKAATGDGLAFFQKKLAEYTAEYQKIKDDQEVAYGAKVKSDLDGAIKDNAKYTDTAKNMAASQQGLKTRLDAVKANITGLEALATANETEHNRQVKAAEETQKAWDAIFSEITNAETSAAHEAAIATLTQAKNDLAAYKKAVAKAFAEGKSSTDKATLEGQLSKINTTIKTLSDGWDDTYNAAVAADNAERKTAYDNAYRSLTDAYAEATELVNKLSKLSYASGDAATDKLLAITGEGGIYDYIDMIRELNATANATYNETEAPSLWDAEGKYAAQAKEYQADVEELATDYSNEVNSIANVAYKEARDKAVTAANNAKTEIATVLHLDATATDAAVKDVLDIINEAKKYAETDDKGNFTYPNFAYILDTKILPDFASVDSKLAADKEKAAEKTWNSTISAANTLATAEKAAIETFAVDVIAEQQYSKDYAEFVKTSIDAAAEAWGKIEEGKKFAGYASAFVSLNNFVSAIKERELADKKKESHTAKYWVAWDEEQEYNANDAAYNDMLKAIADVQSELDKAVAYVGSLLVEHNDALNVSLENVQYNLNNAKEWADNVHKNGTSASNKWIENWIKSQHDVIVGGKGSILYEAIVKEYAAVKVEIGQLKKDYDLAAAKDIEDTTIDQYKKLIEQYEDDNDSIYSAKTIGIIEKYDDKGNPVYKKDDKGYVTSTYAEAQAAYLALEKQIGQTKTALTAIYDEAAAVNAAASIDKAIAGLQETYDALAAQLAECHEPVVKEYQPEVDALKASIDATQAEYDQNTEDGTVLLYAENLLQSISDVAEAYEGLYKDIEDAEKPYDLNDEVYKTLSGELAELQAKLDEVNSTAAGYEYQAAWRESDYKAISQAIADAKADFEKLNAEYKLTEANKVDSNISEDIAAMQQQLAYFNAYYSIDAAKVARKEAVQTLNSNIDNPGILYTAEDIQALRDEAEDLLTIYDRVSGYNIGAGVYGMVDTDLDGNPILDEKGNPTTKKVVYIEEYEAIMAKVAELEEKIAQFAEDVDAKSYIMGDIDHNDKINVNDYNYVRNIVIGALEVDPTDTRYLSADVNGDGDVNIADVIQIANKIMTGEFTGIAENGIKARINSRITEQSADSQLDVKATGAGSKQTITIAIDNISNFVGAQMDIELPAGVTIASESGVVSHDFISGTVNSKHRVLLSSLDNETFSNEELVTLNVEVSGDYKGGSVLISNAIFSDAEGKQYILGGAETGEATGIVELTLGEKVANKIFSVGGQLLDGMKKGINIIMNADGTTKKVLKK